MTASHIIKLLLVEDNNGDARLLEEMLNEPEAAAVIMKRVASIAEAEAYIDTDRIDLVMLDLGLQDAQGLEALHRARAAAPGTPTVVLTGMDDEATALLALQQGAQDYLIKGQIETPELMRAIRYAIEREAMQETVRAQTIKLQEMQTELIFMSQQRAMGTMAATVAHELNQPLTAISNYSAGLARILADGDFPPLLRAGFKKIEETALRAGEIVRRMHIMAMDGKIIREEMDLTAAITSAIMYARSDCDHVAFEVSINHVQPIFADRVQIEQVLGNLIRNACEAMENSDIRVVTITTSDEPGGLLVAVADTGPGIPVGITPFEAIQTSKPQGMGLGLSICRTIVEAHGGRIWAAPPEAGGAKLLFSLPPDEELFNKDREEAA